MSSGPFTRTFYTTDNANVVRIRVQPETLALTIEAVANDPPAGPAAAGFPSAQVSQSNRALGINARKVNMVYAPAATGDLPGLPVNLPWMDPTTFDAIPLGGTGTYNGEPIEVVSKSGESIR
jgi:hypothetical protein